MHSIELLHTELSSIVLFRSVTRGSVLKAFSALLKAHADNAPEAEKTACYAAFVAALYEKGCDLGLYLEDRLRSDDNRYVRMISLGKTPPAVMQQCFERELEIFSRLTRLKPEDLLVSLGLSGSLPKFMNTPLDLRKEIPEALKHVAQTGYGMFAHHGMFRVVNSEESGSAVAIVPVLSPDPISVGQLVGYEAERGKVIQNVKALLRGRPAANMLLVGDAGTGKSSTIKAACNLLRSEGIRLIELRKDQLPNLPDVIGMLADNPLKFLIFIDDLSFEANETGFSALKAVLEGSAAAKTPNVIICATSNRRHIIKETFSAREGDEVHRRDTIEEQTSLSARFGLTVLFVKPDKKLYLEIVDALAKEAGIEMDETELHRQAEVFAIAKGGRSARQARQFVDQLRSSL